MKRLAYILIICALSVVNCQLSTAQDVQRLSEREIIGSARYVGMGGAMTAIGGDPSAILDNPAGLGLYRRNEIAITIDETIDQTTHTDVRYARSYFAVPHISVVWAFGNPAKQSGMIYNNIFFSVNRLANFNRDIVVKGAGMGMAQTIALLTEGMSVADMPSDQPTSMQWNNDSIGWLSLLGKGAHLIEHAGNKQWKPTVDMTDGSLSITESGHHDQYTIAWAGNINNQWYVGVNVNIPTISYTKRTSHYETNRIHSADLQSLYHVSGVGFNGSVGLIYRPMQALRIGASFQTPTLMNMSVQVDGSIASNINGNKYDVAPPNGYLFQTEMLSPLRSSVSVAGQLGAIGMLALQYDYAHDAQMEDVHTLRVGAEVQAWRGVFINTGYVYESSFLKEDPIWMLGYNDVRMDMDYRYTAASQYASAGIGYRSNIVTAQLAYQYRWQTIHQYATEMQMLPFDVGTHTHRIVATLAWRF